MVLLALLIQQVEQASGLFTDEVNTAHIVRVVNVVPSDTLCLVLLLDNAKVNIAVSYKLLIIVTIVHCGKDATGIFI